jgi:catechol 2,3-dioxygenase-like lactoylglutathione lyase family enzyme
VKVHGLVWAGVRTDRFEETVRFFRDVLGVPLVDVRPGFAWSKLPNASQFEIFAAHDAEHQHFTTGPVPEFLVADVAEARAELERAGVEIVGPGGGTAKEGWLHFRAPDGNVYGVTSSASYWRLDGGTEEGSPK